MNTYTKFQITKDLVADPTLRNQKSLINNEKHGRTMLDHLKDTFGLLCTQILDSIECKLSTRSAISSGGKGSCN